MRLLAAILLLAAGCVPASSVEEKRWRSLNGDEVWVVNGPSQIVHANSQCPELANPKGEVVPCKVRGRRLERANGTFVNSEREWLPLCPSCVR